MTLMHEIKQQQSMTIFLKIYVQALLTKNLIIHPKSVVVSLLGPLC